MDHFIVPPPGRNRSVLLPAIHTFIIPTPIAFIFWVLLPIVDTKLVPVAKTFFTMLTLKRPSVWFATYLNMQFIPGLLSKNLFAILAYNCRIVLFRLFVMFVQLVFGYFRFLIDAIVATLNIAIIQVSTLMNCPIMPPQSKPIDSNVPAMFRRTVVKKHIPRTLPIIILMKYSNVTFQIII